MRNNLLFVVFIILVILVLVMISGEKSPRIPLDEAHASAQSEQDCLGCHGAGMSNERSKEHPPKDQCFLCHKRARKKH
ncbi:MAG: hypothetical protein ACWGN7_04995 [Thermodesulfovibrionales bacterium]